LIVPRLLNYISRLSDRRGLLGLFGDIP